MHHAYVTQSSNICPSAPKAAVTGFKKKRLSIANTALARIEVVTNREKRSLAFFASPS
jgi:hypothetical protein